MADIASAAIGVVLIDDHRMFVESLARLLADEDGIEVLGVATTGSDGVALARRTRPQVVLVDFQMPEQDGVAIATQIKRAEPTTMIVMLTGSTHDRALLGAIDAGCSGFLTKDRAAADVADAVRAAAAGEALISPDALARLLPQLSRRRQTVGRDVTDAERDVLGHLAQGWTNRVIADAMDISVPAVDDHVRTLMARLGVQSKLEVVATAVREGVIEAPTRR